MSALKQVGCDPADKKKWGGACAATCIEVVPNVVRAIQGGLHSLCTPTAPVQPEQPGLCNEERHPNELVNSGGAAPPLHPPALAFAQSLSYHSVSEAVCLPMVCKIYTSTAVCSRVSEQFRVAAILLLLWAERLSSIRLFKATTSG